LQISTISAFGVLAVDSYLRSKRKQELDAYSNSTGTLDSQSGYDLPQRNIHLVQKADWKVDPTETATVDRKVARTVAQMADPTASLTVDRKEAPKADPTAEQMAAQTAEQRAAALASGN